MVLYVRKMVLLSQLQLVMMKKDPVVGISDLLIHLSGEQIQKTAAKVIEGEALDVIS